MYEGRMDQEVAQRALNRVATLEPDQVDFLDVISAWRALPPEAQQKLLADLEAIANKADSAQRG